MVRDSGGSPRGVLTLDAGNFTRLQSPGGSTGLIFLLASTEAARFDSNGRFGIGTGPTVSARLDVNGNIRSTLSAVSFAPTPAFDASLGNSFKLTLTGSVTSSTLSNAQAGQIISWIVCQDGTGSRTFVWPANVKGGATIGSGANTCSAQMFLYDGANAYAISPGVTGM